MVMLATGLHQSFCAWLQNWACVLSFFRAQVPTGFEYDAGADLGGDRPPKTTNVNLFTMIFYNLGNSIRDTKPLCGPLFCHSSVVNYTLPLLQ